MHALQLTPPRVDTVVGNSHERYRYPVTGPAVNRSKGGEAKRFAPRRFDITPAACGSLFWLGLAIERDSKGLHEKRRVELETGLKFIVVQCVDVLIQLV